MSVNLNTYQLLKTKNVHAKCKRITVDMIHMIKSPRTFLFVLVCYKLSKTGQWKEPGNKTGNYGTKLIETLAYT